MGVQHWASRQRNDRPSAASCSCVLCGHLVRLRIITPCNLLTLHSLAQVNLDAATTTHLQVYRSTEVAEASWIRKKTMNNWTIASLGQGAYESLKVEHLNQNYRGRWPVISHFEKCHSFYRDGKKVMLSSGVSLWDAYDKWCMESCDFKVLGMC